MDLNWPVWKICLLSNSDLRLSDKQVNFNLWTRTLLWATLFLLVLVWKFCRLVGVLNPSLGALPSYKMPISGSTSSLIGVSAKVTPIESCEPPPSQVIPLPRFLACPRDSPNFHPCQLMIFILASDWKHLICPSSKEWIQKMWLIYKWNKTQLLKIRTLWILHVNGWNLKISSWVRNPRPRNTQMLWTHWEVDNSQKIQVYNTTFHRSKETKKEGRPKPDVRVSFRRGNKRVIGRGHMEKGIRMGEKMRRWRRWFQIKCGERWKRVTGLGQGMQCCVCLSVCLFFLWGLCIRVYTEV